MRQNHSSEADEQPFSGALSRFFAQLEALTGCSLHWKDVNPLLRSRMGRQYGQMYHPHCMAAKGRDPHSNARCMKHCGFHKGRFARDGRQQRATTCHAGARVWHVQLCRGTEPLGVLLVGPMRLGPEPSDLPLQARSVEDMVALVEEQLLRLRDEREQELLDLRNSGMHPALRRLMGILYKVRHDHDVAALAWHCRLSVSRLHHLCRKAYGETPGRMRDRALQRRAEQLLAASELRIAAIAAELGFSDQRYFATWFRRLAGCSPSRWRQQWNEEGGA